MPTPPCIDVTHHEAELRISWLEDQQRFVTASSTRSPSDEEWLRYADRRLASLRAGPYRMISIVVGGGLSQRAHSRRMNRLNKSIVHVAASDLI